MNKNVAIIGSGPVGCLLGSLLTSVGISATIYDKRKDPRIHIDHGKSINLALSTRGLTALDAILGNDKNKLRCLKECVHMKGRFVHFEDGVKTAYQPYSDKDSEYLLSVNRGHLNNDLLAVAESRGVKFVFENPLKSINFETKTMTVTDTKTNTDKEIKYDIIIGTDGSNSVVRHELSRALGIKDKTEKFRLGYQEFEILSQDGKPKLLPQEVFHTWPRTNPNFFIALPNQDNTYTCTLFGPNKGEKHSITSFTDEQIIEFFKKEFPNVYNIMGKEKILKDFHTNPFSGLYNVEFEKWNYKGDALVMGDAAHGVVPFYGLGINTCFEGVRHLSNLISKFTTSNGADLEKVFDEFNHFKEHSDVIKKGSIKNADELHQSLHDPHFLFEKEVERELQKRYPNRFIEAHYVLSFTNIPLKSCGAQLDIQEEITKELCKGKDSISQVDWKKAENLVNTKLTVDLYKEKMWYENTNSPKL